MVAHNLTEGYRIRQCYPTDGEWFQVTIRREEDLPRIWLERVILWALVEVLNEIEHIEAITHQGTPDAALGQNDRAFCDRYFVKGGDRSPCGPTWGEVFSSIPPTSMGVTELTGELARPFLV